MKKLRHKKKICIEIYLWTVFSSSFVSKSFSLKAFLQWRKEGWILWNQFGTLGWIDTLLPTRVAMFIGTRLLGTSIRRQCIFILLKDLISYLLNDFKRRLTFISVRSRLAHPFVLSVSNSETPFAIFWLYATKRRMDDTVVKSKSCLLYCFSCSLEKKGG